MIVLVTVQNVCFPFVELKIITLYCQPYLFNQVVQQVALCQPLDAVGCGPLKFRKSGFPHGGCVWQAEERQQMLCITAPITI